MMKHPFIYLWTLCGASLLFACGGNDSARTSFEQAEPTFSPTPIKLFELPDYCEGIVFDQSGFGYVSYENEVVRFDSAGNFEKWATVPGANGHKILDDGTHLVCSMSERVIVQLDEEGAFIKNFASHSEGLSLRAPNDLCLDTYSGVYFSDPRGFQGNHQLGSIHYVDSLGNCYLVADSLAVPNGLVCSADGKSLIVALTGTNEIVSFPILSPGKVGEYQVLAKLPSGNENQSSVLPDGICLDTQGNIYVAHYGTGKIRVLNPQGNLIKSYDAGNLIVSNVAFGGPRNDRLFTTGSIIKRPGMGAVFSLELKEVKGLLNPNKGHP